MRTAANRRTPNFWSLGWIGALVIGVVVLGVVLIVVARGPATVRPADLAPTDRQQSAAPPLENPPAVPKVPSVRDPAMVSVSGSSRVWFSPHRVSVDAQAVILLKTTRTSLSDNYGVWLLDERGAQIGQIETSFSPMAVWRESTQELLVSEAFAGFRGRLTAFDLTDRLKPKWEIELPGRIEYNVYWPGMALSKDERYLFYQTHTYEDSAACRASRNGPACSFYGLGLVDLAVSPPVRSELVLPRDCGVAGLNRFGQAGVTITCTQSSRMLVLGSDHRVVTEVSPGAALPNDPRPNRPSTALTQALMAYERSDGSIGVLLGSGDFWVLRDGRLAEQVRAVPEGAFVLSVGQLDSANELAAIPYRSGSSQTAAGVAAFNVETLRIEEVLGDAAGASFVVRGGRNPRFLIGDIIATESSFGAVRGLFSGFPAGDGWALVR